MALVVVSVILPLAVLAFLFDPLSPSHAIESRRCLKPLHAEVNHQPVLQVDMSAARQVHPQTVTIAHTGTYWWVHEFGPHWQVPGCWLRGQPLECQYISTAHAADNTTARAQLQDALALVHEGCWDPSSVEAQYRHLPQVKLPLSRP